MSYVKWYYRICIDINDGINGLITVPLDYVDLENANKVFDLLTFSDTVIDARLYSMSNGSIHKLRRTLSKEIFNPENN